MSSWVLVPCGERLRRDLDDLAPDRDTSSDGTIGDEAHQDRTSSHNADETGSVPVYDADKDNEVHAIDLDDNLNHPDLTMEDVVQHVLARCRSGKEKRCRYIIYNRRIWEKSNDWRERDYTGDNAHTEHGHFDLEYDTKLEADTSPWLEDLMGLTNDDKNWIIDQLKSMLTGALGDVVVRRNPDGSKVGGDNPMMTIASGIEWASHYADNGRYQLLTDVVPTLDRMESTLARIDANTAPLADPPAPQ